LKRIVQIFVLLLCVSLKVFAQTDGAQISSRVFFEPGSTTVKPELRNNQEIIASLLMTYNSLCYDKTVSGIRIVIRGNASVEGGYQYSMSLAERRGVALGEYLKSNYSIPDSIITYLPSLPVIYETEKALAEYSDSIPNVNVKAIKAIVRGVDPAQIRYMVRDLDKMAGSSNWNWFTKNILDPTRFADIIIEYKDQTNKSIATEANTVSKKVVDIPTIQFRDPLSEEKISKAEVRLGTNLLYDAATVANLSLEVGFAKHFAFNVLTTYSPWDIKSDLKIRTLLIQPEFRYYFAKEFKGHYLGIEGHYGWYNVALGGKTRYQDKDGNTPLWGAGLSYGYVVKFSKHWGMDFSISAGYANLVYDCFYNIDNGAKYTTQATDWWGPTKVGVSIFYQF